MIKNSKILCIGLGKLGLIFSQILAEKVGYTLGFEVNKNIIKSIKNNKKSIEPNLNKLIKRNRKNFELVNSIANGVYNSSSAFLILPTPSKKNKEFDNSYIENCLDEMGPFLKKKRNI